MASKDRCPCLGLAPPLPSLRLIQQLTLLLPPPGNRLRAGNLLPGEFMEPKKFQDSWLDWASVLSSLAWSTTVLWGAGQGLWVEDKDEDPGPQGFPGPGSGVIQPCHMAACHTHSVSSQQLTEKGQCPACKVRRRGACRLTLGSRSFCCLVSISRAPKRCSGTGCWSVAVSGRSVFAP